MRDAIAELDGIEKVDIAVDAKASTATVGLDDGDPSANVIVNHMADTRFKLTEQS